MNLSELLIVVAIGSLILAAPLITLILSIISFRRSSRIAGLLTRVSQLETRLDRLGQSIPRTDHLGSTSPAVATEQDEAPPLVAVVLDDRNKLADELDTSRDWEESPVGWETFVGQKAFGWLAVVLFAFSAAFFLRYAFQNNWIGPVGRVAIGELAGIALVGAGWWYYSHNLARFSQMLTAAGIVVLYLSTYAAFGLYRLLPQTHAGFFMAILVFESMLAAVIYRSTSIAMAAVIGGLLTPVLLASDHDTYWSLFTYLVILNAATLLGSRFRRWPAVTSVAYLGTQGLFWLWYDGQYHPEKFAWALGFQVVIFALYVAHLMDTARHRNNPINVEELIQLVITGLMGFTAIQVLIRDDYHAWLGTLALVMSALYSLVARNSLTSPVRDNRLMLTSLSLSVGFVAWALPLQANARWVAIGWAAIGLALWWFGLRVSAPALRILAAVFGVAATGRLLIRDLPLYVREPFVPILNWVAFPSLCVAGCLITAVVLTDPYLRRLKDAERVLVAIAGVVGVMLLWIVLSFECYGYFVSQSVLGGDISVWIWRGQLALTVFWTAFATVLLVLGFRLERARLRWLAISLYGITVIKLFVVDMANVQQLYRILAFFVLAVVLGLVAKAYQRFK